MRLSLSKMLPLIGIIIFIYIISGVDLNKVFNAFIRISPVWFLITLIVSVIIHGIKGLRWKMLIDVYGQRYPLKKSIKWWLVGYALSLITPGKIGDFARAYYIRKEVKPGKALTTVIADRIIDVFVVFLFAIIGVSLFVNIYIKNDILLYGIYSLFIVYIVSIFLFSKKGVATKILKPFYRAVPKKYKNKTSGIYHSFYSGVIDLLKNKKCIIVTTMVTIGFWLLAIFQFYTLSIAMGLNIPYLFLFMSIPVMALIMALPISFSGLGTREAVLIFFFSFVGISPEVTISFSLMNLLIEYLFALVGFGLFYKNPIKLKDLATEAKPGE